MDWTKAHCKEFQKTEDEGPSVKLSLRGHSLPSSGQTLLQCYSIDLASRARGGGGDKEKPLAHPSSLVLWLFPSPP